MHDIPPSEGLDREVSVTLRRLAKAAWVFVGVALMLVAFAIGLAAARAISAWFP